MKFLLLIFVVLGCNDPYGNHHNDIDFNPSTVVLFYEGMQDKPIPTLIFTNKKDNIDTFGYSKLFIVEDSVINELKEIILKVNFVTSTTPIYKVILSNGNSKIFNLGSTNQVKQLFEKFKVVCKKHRLDIPLQELKHTEQKVFAFVGVR